MQLTLDYLIDRLHKECQHSSGYIGVEYDNLTGENEQEKIESFFFAVKSEIDYLTFTGHEETKDYGEDKAFNSVYYVGLHINRLKKYLKKYES